jgi:PAS domain S-box-containing protein
MSTDVLRVLLVEGAPATADLWIEAFQKAGVSVFMDVSWGTDDFERRVGAADYDVILAAYDLTTGKGIEVGDILRRLGKNIPTITVTGPLGSELAVEYMRHGAANYVLKERLGRLTVRRAIDENMLHGKTDPLAAALVSYGEGILIAEAASDWSSSKIVFLNTAFTRITGYSSDDLIGKPLSAFHPTETGEEFLGVCEAKLPDLDCVKVEINHARKDGSMYDAECQISHIRDYLGRVSHYVVMHRDITASKRKTTELERSNEELVRNSEELKQAVLRAEAASRAKSDFLVSVSHEIRTPMNVIVGMADLLSGAQLTSGQAKYVEVFQRAAEDLLVLVNHLLDLSKIESGKFELEHIDFDLTVVLRQVTSLFEIPARAKGLNISLQVAGGTPTRLIGDPYQLQQVLINLVGNAVKFTAKGSITIEAGIGEILTSSECTVKFTVADTGAGIPDEKKASVFENFTQADSSFSRLYGGTGLGLAICRALVEKMDGTIMVESAIGVGSTFRFVAKFGLQSDGSTVELGSSPCKILLCEDSDDNAFLVKAYLEGTKYQIDRVADGKAALDIFKSERFDVVLMDMQMPVLDGYSATRQIRQWESANGRRPTPILALTALAQTAQAERCEACGCTAFLSKPIRKAALLAALAEHLSDAEVDQGESDLPLEVQQLVPAYLTRQRVDLDRLRTAISAADYDTISTLGHQLKGSGTPYGFHEFSKIGSAIEQAAKTLDLEEARRQAQLLGGCVSLALTASPNIP